MVNDFIFELGCEELPSGAVWPLADELAKQVAAALDKAQLTYSAIRPFATPRRIALSISDLQAEQASQTNTRKGPAVIAAYDKEGKPTQALLGFAKSCGVELDQLTKIATDKGDWIVCELQTSGAQTKDLIPGFLKQAIASLPIAKPMRWGSGDMEFIRPVHWAVMIYGSEILKHDFFGVTSGNKSRGHRFHHPEEIIIQSAKTYAQQLQDAYVVADFGERRKLIVKQVSELAATKQALAVMPEELIDEVTSIVEWPQALLAHFEEEFLEVPAEALIASMQAHQKCFALKDTQGQLIPYFITVSNIASTNPKQVILGNEKVMRARLSDAAFFFKQDKKLPLSHHISATEKVVFQVKLGSLKEKADRVKGLMLYLGKVLNLDAKQVAKAAELSKCDLMTGMVGEFPELQGLMGYYYALNDGEVQEVAQALNEQYMPRFAADELPHSSLGLALSLADRIDTLVGIFGIGQKPTGVKDPFKLRRHALAVVRMLVAIPTPLDLDALIAESIANYKDPSLLNKDTLPELKTFILERLNSYFQSQGISADLVLAVRARQDKWLFDLDNRVAALKSFVDLPEAAVLSAACKRVNNLLNHAAINGQSVLVNEQLLEPGAEEQLFKEVHKVSQQVEPLYREGNYVALLQQLASLRKPVDAFFTDVMVMVDNEAVKNNRLSLLAQLQNLLQGVADISVLQ